MLPIIVPTFSALADDTFLPWISLNDDYDLRMTETGFMVQDISDRLVLHVKSLPVDAKLYYSELDGGVVFKVTSSGSENVRTAGNYYWFNKGDDTTEQLTQEQFRDRLSRLSLHEDDIQWHDPEQEVEARNTIRYKLLNFYHRISLLLGLILPIPFILLTTRYLRLRKYLRELETRNLTASPKIEAE